MSLKRVALLASALLAGCSSSSNSSLNDHDAGAHGDATTGDDSGTSSGGGDSGSSSGGGDAQQQPPPDCGIAPTLPPSSDAGPDAEAGAIEAGLPPGSIFCAATSAGVLVCPAGDECCLPGSTNGVSQSTECAVFGAPCLNGSGDAGAGAAGAVLCDDIDDCRANGLPGATACCMRGAQSEVGCSYPYYAGGESIVCEGDLDSGAPAGDGGATACQIGEVQVCQSSADCLAGTHCVAAEWRGRPMGVCK